MSVMEQCQFGDGGGDDDGCNADYYNDNEVLVNIIKVKIMVVFLERLSV